MAPSQKKTDPIAHQVKKQFEDVRWMEIGTVLRELSENGTKEVTQLVFKGQRLDAESVRSWHALASK